MAKKTKNDTRLVRKFRIRRKLQGTPERPRLAVFKSSRYIYAQIIDDISQNTVVACSSLEKSFKGKLKSSRDVHAAKEVGKELAQRAKGKKISAVVFDRNGFVYHGRIKALADAAREAGLHF